ncbi:MAG: hypothetical protein ACKVP0_03805 [Pirellulaceae bacterium]
MLSSTQTTPAMKYSLRSLMIVVLVLPPLLAGGWFALCRWHNVTAFRRMQWGDDEPDIILEPVLAHQKPSSPTP